jgi:CubicO group peptidase (beta-lactamase class C family)
VKPALPVLLLCVLSCGGPASARQSAKPTREADRIARFERELETLRTTLRIPGLSAAIVRDQKLLWSKGLGYADVENKVPATPETNYRIASLTKTFASALLLQLVEQGRVDLDAPMVALAPAFHQRFKNDAIRVRHVFTHTSHDTPGESYRYDGNRFSYLTAVIEKASGTSFRELLVRNILDKVRMAGSVPGQDVLDDRAKWPALLDAEHTRRYEQGLAKLARPYRLYGTDVVQAIYPPRSISAAAGLISNAADLAKYDAAIDRHAFIKAETQERAWTPTASRDGRSLPYGLGWFVYRHQGLRLVWHYGYWPDSFSSLHLKVPEKNLSLILLANSDALSAPFRLGDGNVTRSAFANAFLRLFVFGDVRHDSESASHDYISEWLAERRASVRTEIRVDPKIYDRYVGRYEVETGESLTVMKDGDRLFVSVSGFPRVEVFPEAENRFFGKAQEVQCTFDNDGVEIRFWGRRIRGHKVKGKGER